ncbi:replication-relaxation family protein [Candidatus Berkelbacteria bacterium]|nr:replication-relaxation family protein [Candidatus Berkelbacteria bacterium]
MHNTTIKQLITQHSLSTLNTNSSITSKQQTILHLLYRFRFLNRIHIQQFLNHKDHKRINVWLRDLTAKNYLGRIYDSTFPNNVKPAIYYIELEGIRWLKTERSIDNTTLKKFYRESQRTERFIDHCQLIGQLYLELEDHWTNRTQYRMFVPSDYPNLPRAQVFAQLLPHAFIVKRQAGKEEASFVEILDYDQTKRLRQRMKQYVQLYSGYDWQPAPDQQFPIVRLICPTLSVLITLKRMTKKLLVDLESERMEICLTTREQVEAHSMTGDIWEYVGQRPETAKRPHKPKLTGPFG